MTPPPTAPRDHEAALELAGCRLIAGVDEAGRGALAGPVVVAAVILPPTPVIEGIADSKLLSPARREALAEEIRACAIAWSVAVVSSDVIDAGNILAATHVGMRRALLGLAPAPDHALIDGLPVPDLPVPNDALVDGDKHSYSIAAASILAKTHRDRTMCILDGLYPGYGFAGHKGYGAKTHLEAIVRLGPCPVHRRTFAGCRDDGQGTLGL
jgi:ribonuclease HII